MKYTVSTSCILTPELVGGTEGRVKTGAVGSFGVDRSPASDPAEPKLEKRGVAEV